MVDLALDLLGHYARVQAQIEVLIQLRLRRDAKDVLDGLGVDYFARMTDAARGRWLGALAEARGSSDIGARLQSVMAETAEARNHLAHAPFNFRVADDDLRVGSARWMSRDAPSDADILRVLHRLSWVDAWVVYLLAGYTEVSQARGGEWVRIQVERPSDFPPDDLDEDSLPSWGFAHRLTLGRDDPPPFTPVGD